MQFQLSEVADAVHGDLLAADDAADSADVIVAGASIDSRAITAGQLFVPIVAERDGHRFIASAAEQGASATLLQRAALDDPTVGRGGLPAVVVADTAAALAALGVAARRRLRGPVIGVTGSVGKTSVKDLTAAALRGAFVTAASERSFNNELGVPLTLVNAPDDTEVAVVEMGARGEGHIAALCAIARPTIGIVTRVAPAHLELFGSVEGVARAKGELIEALPVDGGVAVLNADDPLVLAMASRAACRVLTYGTDADVRAEQVTLDERARPSFRVVTPWGAAPVRLAVTGAHMVGNALAALGAALAAGASLEQATEAIAAAALSPWRMELASTPGGAVVLNDAYNASPVAVRAAFDTLLSLGGTGRRIAVLGRMAELGETSVEEHRAVADVAAARGIVLYAVGTDLYGVAAEHRFADVAAAAAALEDARLGAGDVVLVKASRVVGLERLAARLVGGGAQP